MTTNFDVYSVAEIARKTNLAYGTILKAIKGGSIPAIKVGDRYLVPRKAWERLLEEGANS